jgi:outer membrane lipoprotein SlyB
MHAFARSIATLAAAAALVGCAHRQSLPEPVYSPPRHVEPAVQYGRVSHVERIGTRDTSGGGAVVGGVVGAVVGRSVAGSDSKTAGTVIGGVAGAVIGNEIEKNQRGDGVRVTVQLDRGGMRRFDFGPGTDLRVGDRVRIEGDRIYRW